MPAHKKLTPEKAHYLFELREQMNNGSLRELQKQTKNSAHSAVNRMCIIHWFISLIIVGLGMSITHDEDEDVRHCTSRAFSSSPCLNGDNSDDDEEPDFNIRGTYNDDTETPGLEEIIDEDDDEDDRNNINGYPPSPQVGQKHSHCDSDIDQLESGKFCKAIKVKDSRGKPKANDWEPKVQDILAKAILSYETKLATLGFFPDHMQEVTWAKVAWLDGCRECNVKIHHNTELIKLVWICVLTLSCTNNLSSNSSQVEEHIFVVSSRPKLVPSLRLRSVLRSLAMMLSKRTARKLRGSRKASVLYIV